MGDRGYVRVCRVATVLEPPQLRSQQRQRGLGHRQVDVGTLAGGGPACQRSQHRDGGVKPGDEVRNEDRRGRGRAVHCRLHSQVAAQGEVVQVVGGPVAPRAVLPEPGYGAVDQGRVDRPQRLAICTQTACHTRPPPLQYDIGPARQGGQHVAAFGGLQVQHQALLAPVEARPHAGAVAQGIAPRGLHADHPRAQVSQYRRAEGPGHVDAEVDDRQAG